MNIDKRHQQPAQPAVIQKPSSQPSSGTILRIRSPTDFWSAYNLHEEHLMSNKLDSNTGLTSCPVARRLSLYGSLQILLRMSNASYSLLRLHHLRILSGKDVHRSSSLQEYLCHRRFYRNSDHRIPRIGCLRVVSGPPHPPA